MNRDERVEAWLDGSLDEAGCAELAREVAAEPVLAARLADASRLDLALGVAHGRRPDLAGGVMAGLRGNASRGRLRQSVMRDLPRRRHPTHRMPWAWVALAAAACLAMALLLLPGRRPAPVGELGAIVSATTAVQLRRDGQELVATPGLRLRRGDTVRVPAGAGAVLDAGTARLELGPGGELAMISGDALHLASGTLRATVEPRGSAPALVFTTPQAQATVLGTVFALAIDGQATLLEVEHGRVGLSVRGRPATVEVGAGGNAIASANADPAAIPSWQPLFASGLDGWIEERGAWSWHDGVVQGGRPDQRSRLASQRDYAGFVLECRIRVTGTSGAEVQADDYRWFIRVPQEGGWHMVRIIRRGALRVASVDGQPVQIRSEGGGPSGGPLAFYVRDGGTIEIRDARISALP